MLTEHEELAIINSLARRGKLPAIMYFGDGFDYTTVYQRQGNYTMVALYVKTEVSEQLSMGVTKRSPRDTDNVKVGAKIALHRALLALSGDVSEAEAVK